MEESTLVIVKPEAYARGLTGTILPITNGLRTPPVEAIGAHE